MEVDIDGVKRVEDFEFIEIVGDKYPYTSLLGTNLAFNN